MCIYYDTIFNMKIPDLQIHDKTYKLMCRLYDDNNESIVVKLNKNDSINDALADKIFSRIKITQYSKSGKILSVYEKGSDWYSVEVRELIYNKLLSITSYVNSLTHGVTLKHNNYYYDGVTMIEENRFIWTDKDFLSFSDIVYSKNETTVKEINTNFKDGRQLSHLQITKNDKVVTDKNYKRKKFIREYSHKNNVIRYFVQDIEIIWNLPEREGEFCGCKTIPMSQ